MPSRKSWPLAVQGNISRDRVGDFGQRPQPPDLIDQMLG
jgi:hypothetical protein